MAMTDKRRIALMITAILALAVIAFTLLYTVSQRQTAAYRDSIRRAEEAYKSGDYEVAIAQYKAAINEDRTSIEAYEGLSNAYYASGDYASAKDALWTGYKRTSSNRLYSLWFDFQDGSSSGENLADAVPAGLNRRLLQLLAGGTYQTYAAQGEPFYRELQGDGSILVRFPEVAGLMVFRNSLYQRDAVSGNEIRGDALPDEIRLDAVEALLGGKAPYTRADLESMGITDINRTVDPEIGSALRFKMEGCAVTIACSDDEMIVAEAENTIIPVDELARRGGSRITDRIRLTGTIIDAQTGSGVDGITLRFRGQGNAAGEISDVSVTGIDGVYEIDLPPGLYTVETDGAGYIAEEHIVEIGENEIESEENFTVTRELDEGEVRLVLTWGESPLDLDSHLYGSTDSGSNIHIYYQEKSSSDPAGTIAELDLDDTTSYGPETTTIHNLAGRYEYYVHNYTPSSGTLEGSGATVTVYLPGQPVRTFQVNEGPINEDTWYVCTIDHGKLSRETGTGTETPDSGIEKEREEGGDPPEAEESPQPERGLTMEDVGLPFGLYEGYKHNTGDGAIEAALRLNEDMSYRLECVFALFGEGEDYTNEDNHVYTGTYRVDRIDRDGSAVLSFENVVKDFEMKQDDLGLDCEYFSARFPVDT